MKNLEIMFLCYIFVSLLKTELGDLQPSLRAWRNW